MSRIRIVALQVAAIATSTVASAAHAQGPNPTNLWSVPLSWRGSQLIIGAPLKLTHDEGSNSQPSFSPDGRAIVYSSIRDTSADASSDIYRYDFASRRETRVTRTPENENSPTLNARGEYVALRWVGATLFTEYGPWVYAADGTPKRGVLRGPDSTGYYTPLPGGNYALTRPKTKTMTVALFDSARGTIVDVDSGVPALPAQRVPGRRALSYVRLDTLSARHEIREVDLATRRTTTLVKTIPGRMPHAWIPGHATILMAKGNVLYARRIRGANADTSWRAVATFADPELRNVTAYVVSPSGDRLILISPKRPPLAVLIRDSLEAGHSGAEVAAMVSAWRDAGRLSGYDVSEGGVSAIANERMVRAHSADVTALRTLTLALFPSSHRAAARLGDAFLATGDTTSASASYRKALANNPRSTDAERKAAADVEAKLKGLP